MCYRQDEYIQSRASAMENIESTIVELGSIFQELAHMVKEQEEQIERFADLHSIFIVHKNLQSWTLFLTTVL